MAKGKASEWLDDDKLLLLQGWARDGLSDEQIAENMGISVRTLYRWKNEYWQICHALKKGKDAADREIENALFKRAKGYDYEEIREETKDGKVVKKDRNKETYSRRYHSTNILVEKTENQNIGNGGTGFSDEGPKSIFIFRTMKEV